MSFCAIILAAGDGKRMKSAKPKVLCEVLGDPMLGWVLDSVRNAGIPEDKVGVVIGNGAETVKSYLAEKGEYRTFMQAERKGTGHAVMQAEEMLKEGENVLVLCGDAPFVDADTILAALNKHTHRCNDVTAVTAVLPDPGSYGRVLRDTNGAFAGIVESKDCTLVQLGITEVNSGVYWFRAEALRQALAKLTYDNKAAGRVLPYRHCRHNTRRRRQSRHLHG